MGTDVLHFVYIFFVVNATLFGIVIGSFLNVVIYRIPAGRTIVKGHSMCMSCDHTLAAKDLVPLFSWLFLKGKCRYCGAPVASRYAKIESLTGVVFLIGALTHLDASLIFIVQDSYEIYAAVTFVLFAICACMVISAMMIWYDTLRGFKILAVTPVIASFIVTLMSTLNVNNITPIKVISVNAFVLALVVVSVLLCGLVSLIFHKPYSRYDCLLDLGIMGTASIAPYTLFTSIYIQLPVFAVVYALIRALLRKTSKEKYIGIIGGAGIVIMIVLRYFIVK